MDPGRLWRSAVTALVLATFLAGRQIASWGTPRNRWDYFWQRQDAWALIVAVLLLALLVFAAGMVLSRWEWSRKRRLHEIGLVLGLIAALLSQFPALNKNPSVPRATLLWIGVAGLVWVAWRRWPARLPAASRAACLVMSPLVPILFGQMLLWKPWDIRQNSVRMPPPAENPSARPFVVLVIFDEWSWFRVAPSGEISPDLPNLRRLAARSVLVREARSTGFATRYSLPRLLFEAQGEVEPGDGMAFWRDSTGRRPTAEIPDLFDRVRELGYRSDLIGFYLNYRALLGPDGADHIESLPYAYKRRTWRSEVGLMLMRNLQHWTDPVSQTVWPVVSSVVYSQSWVLVHQSMRASLDRALAELPNNTFLLAHLPLPHAPFIFEADGTFHGRYEGERMSNDSAGYSRNLQYTDLILGRMLDALERAGRLDRTLFIATSDHAWRKEPDSTIARQSDAELRVPLLIKWPGQDRPLVSDEPFCQLGIWPVFQAAMTPPAPPPMTDSLWQTLVASGRERHCTR